MAGAKHINFKSSSYRGGVTLTPSNTVDLVDPASALYIGVAGALKVDLVSGETVTFVAVPVGIFPIAVTRVYATGTAATDIVGLK